VVYNPLLRAFARLPGGEQRWGARHGPSYGSEHEDETRAPMFTHDASSTHRKRDEGERERDSGCPGGNVGRITGQSRCLLVS
jgi:hypothetical protein